jgi:hypothetical protein
MDERWQLLVGGARAMMADRQQKTCADFGVDFTTQYEWNVDRAELVFSRNGEPIVRANLQFLGSIAGPTGTWLWGWANESIPMAATNRLMPIRQYGESQGFPKLTEREWTPSGDDGHDLMLVSASILESQAFFHDHYQNLALFFVLDGFERIACKAG